MKIAVVVSSCDSFSECWEPFVKSLDTYWEDCPWDIFIVSNYESIQSDRVKFIRVGADKGWASNLKLALMQVRSEYVIYLQEDYFLTGPVNSGVLSDHIDYCEINKIDYLRLFGPFFDSFSVPGSPYSVSPKSKPYRLSLRNSIWKRSSLERLLIDGYSGWDFEWKIEKYIEVNKISIKSYVLQSEFYPSMAIPTLEHTAVHKGMWTRQGYNFLLKNGFGSILRRRKVEGVFITFIIENEIKWMKPMLALILRLLLRFKVNI